MKAVPSLLLVVLLAAACSAPSPSAAPSGSSVPVATPSATKSASPEPTAAPSETPSEEPIADDPPALALEEVASGLAAPINVASTPDGWLLVNERGGRVIAVDPDSGATEVSLDISDRVLGGGERGCSGWRCILTGRRTGGATPLLGPRGDVTRALRVPVTDEPQPPRLDPSTSACC